MGRFPIFLLAFLISLNALAQTNESEEVLDSIIKLRAMSNNVDYPFSEQLTFAKTASELSYQIDVDTTILASNRNLAMKFLDNNLYSDYQDTNKRNLELSLAIGDSVAIASAYRNMAFYHYIESHTDSSFYFNTKSREIYRLIGDKRNEAEVLFNMADLQETEGDYVGSEGNVIESLRILQSLPEDESTLRTLWYVYNLLGLISYELENFDQSLEYHRSAIEISEKMNRGFTSRMRSMNNMALSYKEMGQYEEAINTHLELFGDERFIQSSPESFALQLGNLANSKFLSGNYPDSEVLGEYWRSMKMSDTLDYEYGLMSVYARLSEFYMTKQEHDSAMIYSERTYDLAKKLDDNDTRLEALLNLSEIVGGDEGIQYLNEHIRLSDSLLQNERAIRNKFARIEFETDQIIAENQQISRERLIFLLAAIALFVTLILLYIIISQRSKNRELRFNQMQQEANEEIYNLMLAQQDKIDEGRTKEKKRISEELHDGILGRLFGTRLSLDSLNFQNSEEAIKTRSQYIDELKSIEQEIRKISHDLNTDFIGGSSFSDILKTLIDNQTQAYQLTYDYHEDQMIDWDELNNRTKIHIYRMLQETMQNVYKHAKATHIKISFELKNDVILLTVEDNGVGFNTNRARRGIGLKNFDSRASEIGGRVEIVSKEGQGTRVNIFAPIT